LILVVDDENAIREMVSISLTSQGFRVATAANGADAVGIVERQASEVRLVLLDADMPVMNGAASLPLIRASAPAVPVIFMSGQISPGPRSVEISQLIKPFRIEQLLETIAGVLARSKPKPD
jgi:DNA-binding response OmpR family regulator